MSEKRNITLPDWATYQGMNGEAMVISVDAHKAYPELLVAYAAYYAANPLPVPGPNADVKTKSLFAAVSELDKDNPTAYWLEVVYQAIKLELQRLTGTFALNILIHDKGKLFAQNKAPQQRSVIQAAGGMQGGKEAREHYVRLRGALPK